jgi:uncharacterized membrane protein
MSDGVFALALVTALGCGLAGGAFFAFSTFIMKALGRLPAAEGIAAMQSINVVAITPVFMTAVFGTALACVAVAVVALFTWDEPSAVYLLVGGALYLAGTILPTIACNVPRNDALASLDPAGPEAARYWGRYLTGWSAWNHVRTVAALAASGVLIWGVQA